MVFMPMPRLSIIDENWNLGTPHPIPDDNTAHHAAKAVLADPQFSKVEMALSGLLTEKSF